MIAENVFEMPQFDGSSIKLLWKNPDALTASPTPISTRTVEFDRGDYPLLLVVSKVPYVSNTSSTITQDAAYSASYSVLINEPTGNHPQIIGGDPWFVQTALSGSQQYYEGFFRTATVVENGLTISDCQWKYGTYEGSVNINRIVIPYQIYGIR